MDLLHIFLDALRFPTQRLPNNSLRRNVGSDNHVVTVSGKHCALAGIVEWGLERDKTIDNLHRPREYFPCPQYSHDISLFLWNPKVCYHVHKNVSMDPITSEANQAHNLIPHFRLNTFILNLCCCSLKQHSNES